ncbi:MAG: RHS repeat-associated core domain-containing protein, partial [Acidobacteriota bacterium]
ANLTTSWDSWGNRTTRDDMLNDEQATFSYDRLDRLVGSHWVDGAVSTVLDYDLDLGGNRRSVTVDGVPLTYVQSSDAPLLDQQVHQYSQTPWGTRHHDDAGNLTSDAPGTDQQSDWVYDYLNRPVSLSRPGQGLEVEYRYDALGRRVLRTTTAGSAWSEHRFVNVGLGELEERDETGAVVGLTIHGAGLDEVVSWRSAGQEHFLHQDDLRNVLATTTADGVVEERYSYEDYGAVTAWSPDGIARTSSAIGMPWLYTGRRLDVESGFYYFRNRTLDPFAGRFVTRDPIGKWGDEVNFGNGLAYVGNNPWSRMDPLGLKTSEIENLKELGGRMLNDLYEDYGGQGGVERELARLYNSEDHNSRQKYYNLRSRYDLARGNSWASQRQEETLESADTGFKWTMVAAGLVVALDASKILRPSSLPLKPSTPVQPRKKAGGDGADAPVPEVSPPSSTPPRTAEALTPEAPALGDDLATSSTASSSPAATQVSGLSVSSSWGRNRLVKELHDQGFVLDRPTNSGNGLIYRNLETGTEIRIMPRPTRRYRGDPPAKHLTEYYYRARSGPDQPWGPHTSIPDK